jgi:tripartite-type tricarboxylate transporter receptor subunit TctC
MRLLLLGLYICAAQARDVQKAAPDGHTLLYTIATHVQIPHLYREPPWDPFRDFTPVTAGARSVTVLTAHVSGMPPAEMAQAARGLHERWGAVIRNTGVRLD